MWSVEEVSMAGIELWGGALSYAQGSDGGGKCRSQIYLLLFEKRFGMESETGQFEWGKGQH